MSIKRMCLFLALATMGLGLTAKAAEPTRVAVTNTARVFNEMTETRDLRQKMDADRKRLEAEEQSRREKLRALKETRDQLKPDSPQYQEANRQLLEEAIKFDAWGKLAQADVQRMQKQQMRSLYQQIEAAASEVARQQGFDLVLTDERPEFPEDVDQINLDQLRAIVNARTVLYVGPKADITDAVLALINSRYAAARPAAPSAPAPAAPAAPAGR